MLRERLRALLTRPSRFQLRLMHLTLLDRPAQSTTLQLVHLYELSYGREPSIGGVVIAMDALRERGWVDREWVSGGAERGYRRRSLWSLTEAGCAGLIEHQGRLRLPHGNA